MIYKNFNPIESNLFPKCPFYVLTGYLCPGCGSQRAIHHLLNFEFVEAAKQNVLLVASIPYLFFGFVVDNSNHLAMRFKKLRQKLFHSITIYFILMLILLYWIGRNVIVFSF